MGATKTKSSLRIAITRLNISADKISAQDDDFWNKIFLESQLIADEVIRNIRVQEIRMLRDGSPGNFALLVYKAVERMHLATDSLCNTQNQQLSVFNATKILTRLIPCVFEDPLWSDFFKHNIIQTANRNSKESFEPELVFPIKGSEERDYLSYLPVRYGIEAKLERDIEDCKSSQSMAAKKLPDSEMNLIQYEDTSLDQTQAIGDQIDRSGARKSVVDSLGVRHDAAASSSRKSNNSETKDGTSLLEALVLSICDLLFCPEFTVLPHGNSYLSNAVDAPPEDLKSLPTCDYVWEPGVGFNASINSTTYYDKNRTDLLRCLLTCFSAALYQSPKECLTANIDWIQLFTSAKNRHSLPIFTSLMNTLFGYKTNKSTISLNSLLYEDNRGQLVELALHVLVASLDLAELEQTESRISEKKVESNLFVDYMKRIHKQEDFSFIVGGFIRLLGDTLDQNHFMNSKRRIHFEAELLILLWIMCNLNERFVSHLLKSHDVLDIVVPILFHLNENFQNTSNTSLVHVGVFNLLILSGQRNFGVRLNKQYNLNLLAGLPDFQGSHADLLIIVAHKLIMYGQGLEQLYKVLLTIIANISPYLKGITMLASKCLIQLFETFTSPYVVFTEPKYNQVVVFLLEIFTNVIQYQFDGNTNLVYAIANKKELFIDLANLSTSQSNIDKILRRLRRQKQRMKQMQNFDTDNQTIGSAATPSEREQSNELELNKVQAPLIEGSDSAGGEGESEMDLDIGPIQMRATVSSNYHRKYHSQPADAIRREIFLVATPNFELFTRQVYAIETEQTEANKLKSDPVARANIPNESARERSSERRNEPQTSAASLLLDDANDTNGVEKIGQPPADCSDERETNNGKWRPTTGWLKKWKQSLPMSTVLRTIEVLVPQIELLRSSGTQSDSEVLKYLQYGTLVGLLPMPHPISIRRYRSHREAVAWFHNYIWATIYVGNDIWINTHVKLLSVSCCE